MLFVHFSSANSLIKYTICSEEDMFIQNEICFEAKKYINIPTEIAQKLYFYAKWVGEFDCKKEFYIHRDNLRSLLLLYTTAGSGTLRFGGKTYALEKGSLMFIDCEKEHEYYTESEPWHFKYLHFDGASSAEYYEYIRSLFGSPVFSPCTPDFETVFDKVINDVRNRSSEIVTSEHIYRLLARTIQSRDEASSSFNIQKIIEFISDNYMEKINADSLASTFGFSRSYFSVKFEKATGQSPYTYLTECRISAAKRLLADTDDTVGRISESCGFDGTSAFIRTFKRKTGMSPLNYRKNVRSGNISV